MKNQTPLEFKQLHQEINESRKTLFEIEVDEGLAVNLQYYLIRNGFYSSVIDDYSVDITDKESLIAAIVYQLKMLTAHSFNWDALRDGLLDLLHCSLDLKGVCVIFKDKELANTLSPEFKILLGLIKDINEELADFHLPRRLVCIIC